MFRDERAAAHAKEKALREAAEKAPAAQSAQAANARRSIPKPKGSAGNGFKLIEVMELDKDEGGQQLYRAIQVSAILVPSFSNTITYWAPTVDNNLI